MGIKENETIRKITGDGLSLKLRSNEQTLEIIGDGCIVTMTMNLGNVRIIGDGCRLKIDRNLGNVEYTGDGGRVVLGSESIRDKVRYTGDGGKISFDGDTVTRNRTPREQKKSVRKTGENDWRTEVDGRSKEERKRMTVKNERGVKSKTASIFEHDGTTAKKLVDPNAVARLLDDARASSVKIVIEGKKKTLANS